MILAHRSFNHFWGVILFAVLFGGVLRFAAIGHHSFWYDEAYCHGIATQATYWELASGRVRDNGNPPLHFLLSKVAAETLGTEEWCYRLLPTVFGMATILLTGLLGRSLHSPAAGITSAWLVAISPFQIEMSNEARVYSLVHLLTTLNTLLFLRWMANRTWASGLIYSLCTTVMCQSHYFVVFVILSHLIVLLVYPDRWLLVRQWCVIMGVAAALWSPWAPAFYGQATTPGNLSRMGDSWRTQFGATPVVFSVGRTFGWRESGQVVLGLAVIVSILGYILPATVGVVRPQPRARVVVPLLLSWVLLPVFIPFVLAVTGTPIYHHRYGSIGLIGFLLIVAIGLVSLPRVFRTVVVAVIVAGTTYSLWNYYNHPLKDDWRSATRTILTYEAPDHIVLTDTDIEVVPLLYYVDKRSVALREVYGLMVDAHSGILSAVRYQNGTKADQAPQDYTGRILSAHSVTLALCVPVRGLESYEAQFAAHGLRTTGVERFYRVVVVHFERDK